MKLRSKLCLLLSLFTLVIAGCGSGNDVFFAGGGFGGTAGSGTAAAGLVDGGSVLAFQIFSTHNPAKARVSTTAISGAVTTAANGGYKITLPSTIKNGGILFKLTGGTYKDEATGTAGVSVTTQAAGGLRAAFSNISGIVRRGDPLVVNITPFTELGVQSLGAATPTDVNIAAANARVKTTFTPLLNGVNIFTTKPYDVTVAPPAGTTAAQTAYTLALATISQLQAGPPVQTLDQFFAAYLAEVNAGVLSTHANTVAVANLNFFNNANNKTGTTAPGLTVAVTPAAPTTAAVTTNVAITATVQQNGVNVLDGTQVKFVIKTGTGGTLSAASASTTAGVATVNLTSAVDTAAFVVTATAGGVAHDTALITFADPNKPGAITLAANPTTGVINGQSPVTLTATVTPAGVAGTIANGTVVTFTIVTGTGTLSAVTTTTGGVATAVLNSTVVGTVVVNARAGTAPVVISTPNTSVPFIAQPVTITIKVATTGTLPGATRIGGVNFIVTNNATGLTIADADVTATGTAAVGTLAQPNTTNPASVNVALISTGGFVPTGEISTLVYHIAAGNFPTAANFTAPNGGVALTGAGVIDTNGVAIPGIGVTISSVTIQ
jgi:hypothetical protein